MTTDNGQAKDTTKQEAPSNERVIVITGIRPTFQLYDELSKHYTVAVYNPEAANQLSAARGAPVPCPLGGAGSTLYNKAHNETAHFTHKVVNALPRTFTANGADAVKVSTWAPGVVLRELYQLVVYMRVLDAYDEAVEGIKGIIVHEDVMPQQRVLAMWGKERGIPVIHVPHANSYLQSGPDLHDECLSDWILAPSPHQRDWFVKRGYPKRFVRVTGYPAWDEWVNDRGIADRERAKRMLQLDEDRPVVAFCTGWPQRTNIVDDHAMLDASIHLALQAAKKAGWQLIWKLHPGDGQGREGQATQLAASYRVPALVTRHHLAIVLAASDVVLSVGPSNVLVEAALVDRPPALFNLRGYGFKGEPPWVVEPNVDSAVDVVGSLLDGKKWAGKRDAFVRRYAYRNDGKATKRTVRQIKRIVGV
jgi:hypothetical protein